MEGAPLGLEEDNVKHTLLDTVDTTNWRLIFLNDKWLNLNKDVAYNKMSSCTNRSQLKNVGKYLDIRVNDVTKQKNCKYKYKMREGYYRDNLALIGK